MQTHSYLVEGNSFVQWVWVVLDLFNFLFLEIYAIWNHYLIKDHCFYQMHPKIFLLWSFTQSKEKGLHDCVRGGFGVSWLMRYYLLF